MTMLKHSVKLIKRVFFATLFSSLLFNCTGGKKHQAETVTTDTISVQAPKPPELMFGLPIDSFVIENEIVHRNEFLASILLKYNIPYKTIDELAKKSKETFDVRKIKGGNPYYVFLSNDSLHIPEYFIYEIDKINYVVYGLSGDSITIRTDQKAVTQKRKTVSGTITTSLWNAMTDKGANPVLALDLSDIYAWTIDFFGIAEGDFFKVTYYEDYVDSVSVGISSIESALFHSGGEDFYAFHFQEDSLNYNYFDEKGKSLRKAFLKAPLKYSRISSRFSNSRYHPVLKIRRPHHGVDYAAPRGTQVHTIGDGKIVAKGYQARGGGNYLKIKHNSVYTTEYMHLDHFAKGINNGDRVKQGELIGYVGMTGIATGPHLDFRVFKNGRAIDPLKVKAPPVDPVKKEDMKRYKDFYKPLKTELDNIQL